MSMTALRGVAGAVALVAGPPVSLGRDQAADLARRELAAPAYHQADEPILMRVMRWLLDRISQLVDQVGGHSPGGWLGVLALVVLLVAVVAVVRWRVGPLGRRAATDRAVFDATDSELTAAGHRSRAQDAAARGDWSEAVRERLRAVVRDLQERGLIDVRPGSTADEVAAEGGAALPAVAARLHAGARTFDEVSYGGRAGDAAAYRDLVALDREVAAARPQPPAAVGVGTGGRFEAPR